MNAGYATVFECCQYIKVIEEIEYVRRSTLNMTNFNIINHKKKGRSRLCCIVENDFAATVTVKWKLDFILAIGLYVLSFLFFPIFKQLNAYMHVSEFLNAYKLNK